MFKDVMIAPRSQSAFTFISSYCNNVVSKIYQHPIDPHKFLFCDKKENYFISVSQLIDRKNVDQIVLKFAEFYSRHKEYKLYICGQGEKKEYLSELSKK